MDIELTPRQQQLMDILIAHKKLSFKQIMSMTKNPLSVRTMRNDLVELRGKGLIASEGVGRAAIWYVRKE